MKKICSFIGLMACLSLQAQELICANKKKPSPPLFEEGDQGLCKSTDAGYPYPARVNVKCGWEVSATASYLYWFTGQDGMDLATTSQFISQTIGLVPAEESTTISQPETYNSGFKVGLGWAVPDDNWILRADYTWLHQSTHQSLSAGDDPSDAFQMTNWFYQISGRQQTPGSRSLSSKWRLELDWVDLVLERPFYAGRKLTLNPFMGLRASWIRQKIDITLEDLVNFNPPTSSVESRNLSHAWAIGPRFGIEGHFLLGAGVRFQGEIGGTILYNNFTKTAHSEDPLSLGASPISFEVKNNSNVRTMSEANLGLGWGGYFSRNRYHLDVSATYDFNHLPEQNQIRVLNDIQIDGVNATAKSVYLHGLTLTGTFTF
jgi:hypothetical protein